MLLLYRDAIQEAPTLREKQLHPDSAIGRRFVLHPLHA